MNYDNCNSKVQQDAELIILQNLLNHLPPSEQPVHFNESNPPEWKIKLDGYCAEPLIFVEVWARVGKPKSAQKHKLMNDACKLLLAEKFAGKKARKILAVICEEAVQFLKGNTAWQQKFAETHDIEVIIVNVPESEKERILTAQKLQGWT